MDALKAFAAEKQIQFQQNRLLELLQEAFRQEKRSALSGKRFETSIWEKLGTARQSANRPRAADIEKHKAARPDLFKLVRGAIRGPGAQ